MKRGLLTLNSLELTQLQTKLTQSFLSALLLAKLMSKPDPASEIKIELSEEEGESLLDLLPIPMPTEPADLANLRINLQHFLQALRA